MSGKPIRANRDMSHVPLVVLPGRSVKTEQARLRKALQRKRQAQAGIHKVEFMLTGEEHALLGWLCEAQSLDRETFLLRALVTGAKFLYNSGNVRGGKRRVKGRVWGAEKKHAESYDDKRSEEKDRGDGSPCGDEPNFKESGRFHGSCLAGNVPMEGGAE